MTCDPVNLTSILIALLGTVAGIAGVLFWRQITNIENQLNHLSKYLYENGLVKKEDFVRWQEGRQEIWKEINYLKDKMLLVIAKLGGL